LFGVCLPALALDHCLVMVLRCVTAWQRALRPSVSGLKPSFHQIGNSFAPILDTRPASTLLWSSLTPLGGGPTTPGRCDVLQKNLPTPSSCQLWYPQCGTTGAVTVLSGGLRQLNAFGHFWHQADLPHTSQEFHQQQNKEVVHLWQLALAAILFAKVGTATQCGKEAIGAPPKQALTVRHWTALRRKEAIGALPKEAIGAPPKQGATSSSGSSSRPKQGATSSSGSSSRPPNQGATSSSGSSRALEVDPCTSSLAISSDDEVDDRNCGVAGPIEEDFLEECNYCFGAIYPGQSFQVCSGTVSGRTYCNYKVHATCFNPFRGQCVRCRAFDVTSAATSGRAECNYCFGEIYPGQPSRVYSGTVSGRTYCDYKVHATCFNPFRGQCVRCRAFDITSAAASGRAD
jgi:hypothetical protein